MYCFTYPFYPFALDPPLFSYGTLLSPAQPASPSNSLAPVKQEFKQENDIEFVEKIVLTRADLERAGYEINKKVWTEDEDKLLVFLREKKKMDWIQISKKIPERNKKMCYSRYRRLKNSTKLQWLRKDDQKLMRLVDSLGENWPEITKHFKNRNVRQVKEHYNNYLRPGITECEWNIEDDLLLIDLLNTHGKNWKVVEEGLGGRSLNQIKNRYYGRIKKLNDRKLANLDLEQSCSE